MFSLATGCCSAFCGDDDWEAKIKLTESRVNVAHRVDQILSIVCLVIAILSFCGYMPLGVGIACSVLVPFQCIMSGIIKSAIDNRLTSQV